MKSLKLAVLAISLIGIFGVGNVMAATTNVVINATVVGTCQFDTTNSTSAINLTLDPSSTADVVDTTGSLTFWCTKNTGYTLEDPDNATSGTYSSALVSPTYSTLADYIPFTIDYTNPIGPGAGKTTPIVSALTVTVANGDYVNKSAATDYTKEVVFTLNP